MPHYPKMPMVPRRKELLARSTKNLDETVLREFADLAERLGFHSSEITALKQHSKARIARYLESLSKASAFGKEGGVLVEYMEDKKSLFMIYLLWKILPSGTIDMLLALLRTFFVY